MKLYQEACEDLGRSNEPLSPSRATRPVHLSEDSCLTPGRPGRGRRGTLHPTHAAVTGLRRLVASPDGHLAYSYDNTRSELYVIQGLK